MEDQLFFSLIDIRELFATFDTNFNPCDVGIADKDIAKMFEDGTKTRRLEPNPYPTPRMSTSVSIKCSLRIASALFNRSCFWGDFRWDACFAFL